MNVSLIYNKMEDNSKPSVEELFEAYRRYSRRIDGAFRQCPPVRVNFEKMPLRRRMVLFSRLRTLVAAMMVVVLCRLAVPQTYAMSPGADHAGAVDSVEFMLNNNGSGL